MVIVNFFRKVAQYFGKSFLTTSVSVFFQLETAVTIFLQKFWENQATFYSTIWSHSQERLLLHKLKLHMCNYFFKSQCLFWERTHTLDSFVGSFLLGKTCFAVKNRWARYTGQNYVPVSPPPISHSPIMSYRTICCIISTTYTTPYFACSLSFVGE